MRPAISASGSRVAFESFATNLVSGTPAHDINGKSDVFVWDKTAVAPTPVILVSAAFPRVLVGSRVVATADEESSHAALSANGEWVVFKSKAGDTITGPQIDGNGSTDIFLWFNNESWVVSQNSGNIRQTADGASDKFTLASDTNGAASHVAYESLGTDIVPGQVDGSGKLDVFVFPVWDVSPRARPSWPATCRSLTRRPRDRTLRPTDRGGRRQLCRLYQLRPEPGDRPGRQRLEQGRLSYTKGS